jgi:hypothetical protein
MSGKSLREVTAEIRANNVARGWRPAEGGPGKNTFGDYVALLHTEVAEMTEAYRDWGIRDATKRLAHPHADDSCSCGLTAKQLNGMFKPEGVGSELADVFIRALDMADVFGYAPFDMDCEIGDIDPLVPHVVDSSRGADNASFGDWMWGLHDTITDMGRSAVPYFPRLIRAIAAVAERYEIDLTAEYERKMAYNRTRSFQHGGRTMTKAEGSA